MIVRIVQARVASPNVTMFNILLRQQVDLLKHQDGLEYVKLARRLMADGGEEVLLFEEWRDPAAMYEWAGPDLSEARLIGGARELIDSVVVTHYEALDRVVVVAPVEDEVPAAPDGPPPE